KVLYVYDGTKWIPVNEAGNDIPPSGPTNPTDAKAGDLFYNLTEKVLYVYDGAKWIPVNEAGAPSSGTDNPTDAKAGDLFYNLTERVLYVFDGTKWIEVGSASVPSGPDNPQEADAQGGEVFFNTTQKLLNIFNGTAWVSMKDYVDSAASSAKDNLGNHTATQNVKLGSNSINNDGGAGKGLNFDTAGNASFEQNIKIKGSISYDGDPGDGLSFDADGNAFFGQDVTVNSNVYTPSDRRLKTKVETLTNVMQAINQMRGVSFEYIDQKKYASGTKIGVIAQELQKIYPEMVKMGQDGFLKVDYTQLTAVFIEALKEQQEEIRQLKNQVSKQQEQIDAILKRLDQ
ncbi:MAG TPA: tail fiber domain-containing protein, partial [Daejeonella sp.]|nr:tail fiber domain-containing protein [Daejeonella sp.]